jgi:methyl-accepting chemotaxis protein
MNDLSSQILVYLPFGVIFIIIFACICRLHFDRKSDERTEAEFENIERIDQRAREEVRESSERIAEIKDRARKITERTDSAREQIKSASSSIKDARRNNRRAKEAIAGIEKILSEAKKI